MDNERNVQENAPRTAEAQPSATHPIEPPLTPQEWEQRFRLFMDNSPAPAFIKDEQGRRVYVSQAWCDAFGVRPEEVLHRDPSELFPPAVAEMMRQHDRVVLESDTLLKTIESFPSRTGARHDWMVHKFPFREASGRRLIAGVAVDVTELKQTEATLKREQTFSSTVLETVGCLVLALDPAGRLLRFNPVCERLTGLRAADVCGQFLWDLPSISPDDSRRLKEQFSRVPQQPDALPSLGDLQIIASDGSRRDIAWNMTAISEPDGRVTQTLCAGIDVTELRQAKAAAEHAQAVAEAANLAKSEFLANMSHEIRTPMTAILGHVDLLEEGVFGAGEGELLPQERRQSVLTIRRNAEHLLQLINDILDLSKIEAGKIGIQRAPCSPAQIISDVAAVMRVRALEKKVAFRVQYIGPVPETIFCDALRLRQVLMNLISNALKFTQAGSVRLLVRLLNPNSIDPPQLQFQVIDTGIGMTQEQVGFLFRPFCQADGSTTRRFGGTGLGLSISKRLAEAMGGGISVDSISGAGTTFTVWIDPGKIAGIPLLANPAEIEAAFTPQTKVPACPVSLAGRRILLAEDGPDNQYLISMVLRRAGARVTPVDNGRSAVQHVLDAMREATPFDLVLMDMQMPEMDGYAATRRLRDRGFQGKIIALTAHTMPGDRERCLASGCDDYMPKPFEPAHLIETIARLMGTTEPPRPTSPQDDSRAPGGPASELQATLEHAATTLDQALGLGEMDVLGQQAHALKATAAGLGLRHLEMAAHVVDRAVRAGLSVDQVRRAVQELVAACRGNGHGESSQWHGFADKRLSA